MKKILLIAFACSTLPVFASWAPVDINPGLMQGHDMDSIKVQQFRMRELNDLKEVKEEKKKFEKETSTQKFSEAQNLQQQMIQNTNSEFVEENGQIKIKYMH